MLNETLTWETLPTDVRKTFRRGQAERRVFGKGTTLFKLTQATSLENRRGQITPWWSLQEPAQSTEFIRARYAVSQDWNKLTHLLKAVLLDDVVGFSGQCAGQPIWSVESDNFQNFSNVVFIGGAWQIYVPNLTRQQIAKLG